MTRKHCDVKTRGVVSLDNQVVMSPVELNFHESETELFKREM